MEISKEKIIEIPKEKEMIRKRENFFTLPKISQTKEKMKKLSITVGMNHTN